MSVKRSQRIVALAASLSLAMTAAAMSHEAAKGPNGGVLIDVEGYHVEFVPSDDQIAFYLTDERGSPVSAAGSKIKAIVQAGGKTTQLELVPADPNTLTAPLALGSGAKVVISGTLEGGHRVQARFVVP